MIDTPWLENVISVKGLGPVRLRLKNFRTIFLFWKQGNCGFTQEPTCELAVCTFLSACVLFTP